ncbi:MAG: trigger factor [Acidimicrobiia bacterium]|nr:MAG: trigger factor [Acidimicrobiia bacterium]
MQTEVKESGRFERTLTVQLENDELAAAMEKAAAKISKNMKIKGFRPGRAPLRVVESHVGAEYLRSEAVEEAIHDVVPEAIDEAGLEPVTVPSVTAIRDDNADGSVEIDIVVTLWPVLDALPDFGEIEIEVEDPTVTEEEITLQIDALREQFAELVEHEGDLSDGDFALIDIAVEHEGETVESAGAKDLMYEIGSQSFIEGVDVLLADSAVGATVTGEGTLPEGYSDKGGEDVTLTITIKEAKTKRLPDLTDEMVEEATEFETAAELREAIEANMLAYKVHTQRSVLQDKVVEYVVNEVDFELPEALVSAEVESRVRNLVARLEESEISIEDYLKITGQDEETFITTTRAEADQALSTRVILESISAIESWEVEDAELVDHVVKHLEVSEDEAITVVDRWKTDGQVEALTGDILRERALASLVDSAIAVDSDGDPVDLTPVVIVQEEEKKQEEPEAEEVEESSGASDDEEDAARESEEQG